MDGSRQGTPLPVSGYFPLRLRGRKRRAYWRNVDPSTLSVAFTQLTGVASAAQIPTPTAGTIGGVKSIAPVAHNFLTSLSTAGVPAAAQPAFTDISGNRVDLPISLLTSSSSTLAIDCNDGEFQQVYLSASATAVTVANWPATGAAAKLTLLIYNTGAYNITGWPTGTIWAGGSAPTITSGNGKKDIIVLLSPDGGTTIFGSVVGQNYS